MIYPTVQIRVDQAVKAALSSNSTDKRRFTEFVLDLVSASRGESYLPEGATAFALLDEIVLPEHRRLIAWALLRFLGGSGAFPTEPPELRPRVLAFIARHIGQDLKAHHIDLKSQSHQLESALSQVAPSIERDIIEAVEFRSIDALTQFRGNLFKVLNSKRNSGLLYAFSNRSLLNEALTKSLDAVRSFQDADDFSILETYEYARDVCRDSQKDLQSQGTEYASDVIASVPSALQKTLDSQIANLELAKPATLSLSSVEKKYPLHAACTEIDIRLILHNTGGGTAFDVQIAIEGTRELDLMQKDSYVGRLGPGESRYVQFLAQVIEPENIALLSAKVTWINFDRREDQFTADLELQAQDPTVDWSKFANSQPYALDVAIGDRFVGRTTLLNRLLMRVANPNPGSLYIWGQKRVGKTSLVRALADAIDRDYEEFAVVYLETIRELTAEDTTDAMCRRLISKLKSADLRFRDLAEPEYTGTLSPLSDFIDQLHLIAPEKKFIIIIDEFDELPVELYKGRGVADTFFQTLGKGIAGKIGVGMVLVGGERIPQIIRAQGMRLNMYRPEPIDHFERNEEFSALVRCPGMPLEFSDDAIARLWDYSEGNPYFLNEICSRLAEMMIERHDAYVTADEVDESILITLNTIDSNSFAHYWSDGFVDLDAAQSDAVVTDRIRFLVAMAEAINQRGGAISKEDLIGMAGKHGCNATVVERQIRDFLNRGIIVENEGIFYFRVKLFQEWVRDRGMLELNTKLWDDLGNLERIEEEKAARITESEIEELLASWGPYLGRTITAINVRQWLGQFGSVQDQRLIFKVLEGVRFFREDVVRKYLVQTHRSVTANLVTVIKSARESRRDMLISYLGSIGQSGPSVARLYRQSNKIWNGNCIEPNKLRDKLSEDAEIRAIVFVDDFVGTGRTAIRQFDEFFERYPDVVEMLQERQIGLWYVVVAGTSDGVERLRRFLTETAIRVVVICGEELGSEDKAFSPSAPMWVNAEERKIAEEIAKSFGERLEGRAPLGFGDTQGLVVFESNCPNTSLPILYKRRRALGDAFQPLFPRSS